MFFYSAWTCSVAAGVSGNSRPSAAAGRPAEFNGTWKADGKAMWTGETTVCRIRSWHVQENLSAISSLHCCWYASILLHELLRCYTVILLYYYYCYKKVILHFFCLVSINKLINWLKVYFFTLFARKINFYIKTVYKYARKTHAISRNIYLLRIAKSVNVLQSGCKIWTFCASSLIDIMHKCYVYFLQIN